MSRASSSCAIAGAMTSELETFTIAPPRSRRAACSVDDRGAAPAAWTTTSTPPNAAVSREQPLDVELVGDVGAHRERRAVGGEDLLDRGLGRRLVAQVDHDDGVAAAREPRAISRPTPREPPVTIATGVERRASRRDNCGSRSARRRTRAFTGAPLVVYALRDWPRAARRCCWAGPASARRSIGCWTTSAAARARCSSSAARRASARRRCCTTAPARRPASASRRSPASRPRWSCRSRRCTSSARRCSAGSTRSRSRSSDALSVALGLPSGDAPDRFLVGLAVLSLLAAVAEERPLLCLVDDAQWLDAASGQVLGFVARRLLAESVALVFAVREPDRRARASTACPSCALGGLDDEDARALLATAVPGRLDDRVRDRLVAETRGNPLALLELPRSMSAAELAGGFELAGRPTSRATSRTTTCGASTRCPRRRGG